MAMTGTVTLRLDADLKHQAEIICEEMGLTMSSAITIFIKRLTLPRAKLRSIRLTETLC